MFRDAFLPASASMVLLLFHACGLLAAEPAPAPIRGDQMLDAYLRRQTKQIADDCLANSKTKEDWEKKRPELRRQFLEMIGLWPLPARTDLKATITGKVDADKFTVEKLHFQSSPGLYVTANLYVPKKAKFPAPAVLYVCGHAPSYVDRVPYGSKVSYQHHGIWFAEHGYICLIPDTLQYGEIEGVHHGTHPAQKRNWWWWHTLGYTPAGIECWNAMRALDYLETRKEVDAKRMGVTGISGGGATSWWLAAADDRPQCIVPVAGITDLQAHLVEGVAPRYKKGVISGHCDCMYLVNTYRWDYPLVAALCAPRPLMLGNSDADAIFPVPGYQRIATKVRRIYDLYGARDKFVLLETAGPHKDTKELRLGAYGWMNRWLKDEKGEVSEPEPTRFKPQQLKVFDKLPADAINKTVQETFIKPANPEIPRAPAVAREWWKGQSKQWMDDLRQKVFPGWSGRETADAGKDQPLTQDGLVAGHLDFTSEQDVKLRLWYIMAEKVDRPTRVVVRVLDEPDWKEWLTECPAFLWKTLQLPDEPKQGAKFANLKKALQSHKHLLVVIAPRGIGPTRWSEAGSIEDGNIRRRFVLLGQTLDGQRVWDVRQALAAVRHRFKDAPQFRDAPLCLEGKGDMAGIALYAALFEPEVKRLDLWYPPITHREGPIFLNVRRFFDMPQAVALAFPREIHLHVKESKEAAAWEWPLQLQKALGGKYLTIHRPEKADTPP